MTTENKIEKAKIEIKRLENENINKMSLNIIKDDLNELIKNGKVKTIFKTSINFFKKLDFTITKEKHNNLNITIISL